MKHSVPHDLDVPTLRRVAERALAAYQERFAKYNPVAVWRDATHAEVSFNVKGVSLKGELELLPKAIEMDLDVPFLLRPFKSQALGVIEEEINKWIGKAKAGELG